ncbi:MAG: hypothetical protein HYS75_00745 [Nitrosopumilales archaeon]|nr:hypothetical protein [Nitrosopumilales archaeon]
MYHSEQVKYLDNFTSILFFNIKLIKEGKHLNEIINPTAEGGMCASDGTLVASEYKKEITPQLLL